MNAMEELALKIRALEKRVATLATLEVSSVIVIRGDELTLDAAGAITVVDSYHPVDTFEDAAEDDLVTINGGVDGQVIILCCADNFRDVTLTEAGNIALDIAGDFELSHVYDRIILQWQGTKWVELSRTNVS